MNIPNSGEFKAASDKAQAVAKDKVESAQLVERAFEKAKNNKGRLNRALGDLVTLLRVVKRWSRAKSGTTPTQSVLLALTAVIYFLNPFDHSRFLYHWLVLWTTSWSLALSSPLFATPLMS